ncbi:MAG: hypothetical protein ACRELC_07790 [Gemmatimonadota bacterium]
MTYEERRLHRDLLDRAGALRVRLDEGEPWAPVTREEAREIVDLLDEALQALSPERFDHMMEAIAHEVARRAGAVALSR